MQCLRGSFATKLIYIYPCNYYFNITDVLHFLVMQCTAPPPITGGIFSCDGTTTDFGGTCNLDCDSSSGYTGDTVITCNQDDGDETVSWSSLPTCTGKPIS